MTMKYAWKSEMYCVICEIIMPVYVKKLDMVGKCSGCGSHLELVTSSNAHFVEQTSPWWKFWNKTYTL